MKTLLLILLGVLLASSVAADDERQTFTEWMAKFAKKYSPETFIHRFEVFLQNLHLIRAHNSSPDSSYKLALNSNADLSQAEHKARLGFRHRVNPYIRLKNTRQHYEDNVFLPSSLNWTAQDAVSSVKDQGQCGSCWAFSAVGALEGLYAITNKIPAEANQFSVQELLDCSSKQGNEGCDGGLMDQAFEYVHINQGLSSDEYAYKAETGKCHAKDRKYARTKRGPIGGYVDVKNGSEAALMEAVSKGPVSVAIEASSSQFQLYSSGVIDSTACGTDLDHGVLLVGYGSEPSSSLSSSKHKKDYWLVKNSWGPDWGDHGYVKLARGKNTCGILEVASYPVAAENPEPDVPSLPIALM